jgi:hypothetical protein
MGHQTLRLTLIIDTSADTMHTRQRTHCLMLLLAANLVITSHCERKCSYFLYIEPKKPCFILVHGRKMVNYITSKIVNVFSLRNEKQKFFSSDFLHFMRRSLIFHKDLAEWLLYDVFPYAFPIYLCSQPDKELQSRATFNFFIVGQAGNSWTEVRGYFPTQPSIHYKFVSIR